MSSSPIVDAVARFGRLITEVPERLDLSENRIDELKLSHGELLQQLNDVANKNSETLNNVGPRIEELSQQAGRTGKKLVELEHCDKTLKESIGDVAHQISTIRVEMFQQTKALQKKLSEDSLRISDLETQDESTLLQLGAIQTGLSQACQRLEELLPQSEAITHQMNTVHEERAETGRRVANLEQQVLEMAEAFSGANHRAENLEQHIKGITVLEDDKSKEASERIEELELKNAEYNQRIERLERQLNELINRSGEEHSDTRSEDSQDAADRGDARAKKQGSRLRRVGRHIAKWIR